MQRRRYPQRRTVGSGGANNNNLLASSSNDGVAHVSGGGPSSISIPDWVEVEVAGTEATSAAAADGSSSPERLRDLRGREEEAELRRQAHLHCRTAMDRAFRRAFADSHASLTADLRSFCCHEGRRYKRKRGGSSLSSVDVESSRSTGTATATAPPPHPSILPLAILRVAPSLLDRSHLVRHLANPGPETEAVMLGPRVRVCPLRVGRWCGAGTGRHGGGGASSISLADVMKRIALRCILPSPSTPSPHMDEEELRTADVIDDNDDGDVDASLLEFMERRWGTFNRGGSSISVRESMEVMLHWAGNTNRYDGLAVVLEDREVVPPAVLDGLIACLRTLRSDRGLPVSLVILVPSSCGGGTGGGNLLSGPSSSDGVMVREFVAPDPADVVDHFVDRLVDADHEADIFTAIISPELLEKSRLSFRRDHRSAVTYLCHLKMALANFFSQSGSFVVALHSPSFRRRHGMAARRGLASLRRNAPLVRRVTAGRGGDGSSGRPVLMRDVERWLRMSLLRRRRVADGYAILSVAARVLTLSPGHPSSLSSSVEDLGGSTRPTQLLLAVLRSHDEGSIVLREMCDTMKMSHPLTILKLLKEWKIELKKRQKLGGSEKAEADGDDHDFSNIYPDESEHDALTTFLQGIDELVVLYGEFLKMREDEEYAGTREEQSLKSDLSSDLVCWFQGQMRRWLKQSPGVDECVERFVQFLRIRFPETSVHAESRRTVAVALGGQLMDGEENSTDSCAAFVAMQGDRVISCSQWYNRFCAGPKATKFVAKSEVGEDTMWLRFAFAVYELEACGLVARKCGCRKEEVFEKRAMVWASGKVD